jgi:hypothetical protein
MAMLRSLTLCIVVAPLLAAGPTTNPAAPSTTQPDSAVDTLLGMASTAPSAAPATQPDALQPAATPLVSREQTDPDQRHGTIELSDGTKLTATIGTTVGKPLRCWDEKAGEYRDTPMRLVKSIKAQVLWEKQEDDWRFKESGSDIKINTGKTYPARETAYEITLLDGKTISGGIVAPLYTQDDQGNQRSFVLHKRDKGQLGQTLADLIYVKQVTFDDPK